MELTISEAAHLIGKSNRQIRYLIKNGKLPAHKRGGQWFVKRSELPLTQAQAMAAERKLSRARDVVEEALGPPLAVVENEAVDRRRRFSVQRQPAFRFALPAYRTAVSLVGAEHPAALAMRRALFLITEGWHEFQPQHKVTPLRQARSCLCEALTELLLVDEAQQEVAALSETIELQVIPALGGMLRYSEKGRR